MITILIKGARYSNWDKKLGGKKAARTVASKTGATWVCFFHYLPSVSPFSSWDSGFTSLVNSAWIHEPSAAILSRRHSPLRNSSMSSFRSLPAGMVTLPLDKTALRDVDASLLRLVPQKTDLRGEICMQEILGTCIQKQHRSGSSGSALDRRSCWAAMWCDRALS